MAGTRHFGTGATRNDDTSKHDYEGFLSPLVVQRFGAYMTKHRTQPDGLVRASDNWQLGIPLEAYMKSAWRHLLDWWLHHRGLGDQAGEEIEESICALIFNAQGYLHERLKARLAAHREVRARVTLAVAAKAEQAALSHPRPSLPE
jgi:hypothetical protein